MLHKQDILDEFNEEIPGTRKMLERVPFDKLDFRPSKDAMFLGSLVFLIGTMPGWFLNIINTNFIDIKKFKQLPKYKNVKKLLATFDCSVEDVRSALSNMDEEALNDKWMLRQEGKILIESPRYEMLRQTINHLVHHRAQLGVYLKMHGIPHPALYGASGDEGWR